MRIVWVLNVKKGIYELPDSFSKAWAPQADNDSSDPPEIFRKKVFIAKSFDSIILHSCRKFII